MYLSKSEREQIIAAYDCEGLIEDTHFQVEPDTWVYLFKDSANKKYVLISADYLDFDFDHFPHLLRFNNGEFHQINFVLQREIPSHDPEKTSHNILFEYTA